MFETEFPYEIADPKPPSLSTAAQDAVAAFDLLDPEQQVQALGVMLLALQHHCGMASNVRGFHDAPGMGRGEGLDRRLLLTVGEIIEAQDALRDGRTPHEVWHRADGKPEGFVMELADAVIRLLDLAFVEGLDLGEAIARKWRFNCTRPHLHGKTF